MVIVICNLDPGIEATACACELLYVYVIYVYSLVTTYVRWDCIRHFWVLNGYLLNVDAI